MRKIYVHLKVRGDDPWLLPLKAHLIDIDAGVPGEYDLAVLEAEEQDFDFVLGRLDNDPNVLSYDLR
jgi:hypothetical protein